MKDSMMPYNDYFAALNELVNTANVVYTILNDATAEDHLLKVDKPTYEMLHRPPATETDKREYILDVCNHEVLNRVSNVAIECSFHALTAFQAETINSLNAALSLVNQEAIDKDDFIYFVKMIYVTTADVFAATQRSIYSVSRIGTPEEMTAFENNLKEAKRVLAKEKRAHDSIGKSNAELTEMLDKLLDDYAKLSKLYAHEIQAANRRKEDEIRRQKLTDKKLKELYQLRELLFEIDSNVEPEFENGIQFPYRTTGTIYVVGGAPSWINQMKEKLPDVTYVSPDQNMKLDDKLRNADCIWVQWRAISHAQFNRVAAVADANDIPMFYFDRTSPELCAIQLIEQVSA